MTQVTISIQCETIIIHVFTTPAMPPTYHISILRIRAWNFCCNTPHARSMPFLTSQWWHRSCSTGFGSFASLPWKCVWTACHQTQELENRNLLELPIAHVGVGIVNVGVAWVLYLRHPFLSSNSEGNLSCSFGLFFHLFLSPFLLIVHLVLNQHGKECCCQQKHHHGGSVLRYTTIRHGLLFEHKSSRSENTETWSTQFKIALNVSIQKGVDWVVPPRKKTVNP